MIAPINYLKQGSRPPLWILARASYPSPPRCHRKQPCSGRLLLSTRTPSKIPAIPAISGAMFIWQEERACGVGWGGEKRASLTNSLGWLRVNMCRRGVCETSGKQDWGSCVLVLTHRATLCFMPQPPQPDQHPTPATMNSTLCWRNGHMTLKENLRSNKLRA